MVPSGFAQIAEIANVRQVLPAGSHIGIKRLIDQGNAHGANGTAGQLTTDYRPPISAPCSVLSDFPISAFQLFSFSAFYNNQLVQLPFKCLFCLLRIIHARNDKLQNLLSLVTPAGPDRPY